MGWLSISESQPVKSLRTAGHRRLIELLVQARKRAGVTQAQLARSLSQHQSFVSKIESGERRLDVIELMRICRALDVSASKLVGELERYQGR